MASSEGVTRRAFLADLGRGASAIVVLSVVGCGPVGATPLLTGVEPKPATPDPTIRPTPSPGASDPTSGGGDGWHRVNLGFVSAYILARGGEAAIVDTGVAGSADDIEAALTGVGLDWGAVGHVIATHLHGDHIGSLAEVMTRGAAATGYAGAEDLPAMESPRPLQAVADGAEVFGLRIVASPGHTPGHICVHDAAAGVLVAGDALNTSGGRVTGPNPQFTPDMDLANASVAKLAGLSFETLFVGHGDPIEGGASEQVAALASRG